jgi:hypothetical protein
MCESNHSAKEEEITVTGTEKQGRASVQVARDVSDRADDGGRFDTSRPTLLAPGLNRQHGDHWEQAIG